MYCGSTDRSGMTTKIICVKDQVAYEVLKVGVEAIDMFSSPPEPYKITPADAFQCPVCGHVNLAGFAEKPTFHHEPGFQKKLKDLEKSDLAKDGWVINVYESKKDVPIK